VLAPAAAEPDAPVAIAADLDRAELTAPSDIRLPRSRRLPMTPITLTDRDDKLVVRIGGDDGHGRREQSRVALLAVAAAVVVAAALAAVAVWGPGAGTGSSGGPPPADGATTTEEAPAESGGTARLAGGPVPVAAGPEAMLGAAALDGSHLVAVGGVGGDRPGAWESRDGGATWSPAWSGEAGTAAGVTAGPTGLVAVGWTGGEDEAGATTQAAVWRSPDGSPGGWEPVGATGLEGVAALHDVVADGAGLVAVGRDVNDDADDGDGGIWRSDDGATWRRAATAGLGGPGRQELHRVIRLADGRWLALGRQMRGAQMTPAMWTSSDLSTWTETDGHPSDDAGVPSVWGLAVLEDGAVVAAGSRPGLPGDPAGAEAALWLAAPDDLDRWQPLARTPDSLGVGPGDQQIRALLRAGAGPVAVGVDGDAAAGWPLAITR
jgi:molecular chaperone DnaK